MSLHRTYTDTERAALKLHGLLRDGPSQLADAFVLGMRHAAFCPCGLPPTDCLPECPTTRGVAGTFNAHQEKRDA